MLLGLTTVIRPRNEHTIATDCEVSGRGYWSGKAVTVRFRPSFACTGVTFTRTDILGRPSCKANAAFASGASMRTNLISGSASFQMIEHVMSALYAMEIDNCIVEIDGEELPGMDGSSLAYVDALRSAGMVMQAAARKRFIVDRLMRVGNSEAWIEVSPSPRGCASFEYRLDYGTGSVVPEQSCSHLLTPSQYYREIASARTFVTAEQAAMLRQNGVGVHVTNGDLIVFAADGTVVGNELRFKNECARHKTLDMIGDLALAGGDLLGKFVSFRGGHRLNAELATLLTKHAADSVMSMGTGSQFAPPLSQRSRVA